MASFEARKHAVLESLASDARDKSRAGGVDAPIADLIHRINQHPFFFTTSSCSGRVSIFSEPTPKSVSTADDACVEATANSAVKTKKKGGDWVYVSHETASEDEVSHYYCSSFNRIPTDTFMLQFSDLVLGFSITSIFVSTITNSWMG